MKTLATMTKAERALLLFFETRAVDYRGRVQTAHMNKADFETAHEWNRDGFIQFGRIAAEDCNASGNNWCFLSDEAWALAAEERKARAARMWESRGWQTTEEKRKAA